MSVTTKLSIAGATRVANVSEPVKLPPVTTDPADFQNYLRPKLGKMMHALRLDVEYDFAREDYLEYVNRAGERVRVSDFLGGYGSLLFGHNPPQLTEVAMEMLQQNRPLARRVVCVPTPHAWDAS